MEVMVGSSIKIEDQEFADQDLMVVEVGSPEFVYHYSKQEAV